MVSCFFIHAVSFFQYFSINSNNGQIIFSQLQRRMHQKLALKYD